jgi:hypothetical protein
VSLIARMSKRSKVFAASVAFVLAGVFALVVTISGAGAVTTPISGVPLSKEQVAQLTEAAKSCPALTAAKLAGRWREWVDQGTAAAA